MKFCLDIYPEQFLKKPDYYLELWKESGIDSVQLFIANVKVFSSLENCRKAKEIIDKAGFETTLISVPVGHPGEPTADPNYLPEGWRFRTGRDGKPEYNSSELTDKMISDVLSYSKEFASLGFDTMFMDDDLRQSNLSPLVGGCFCRDCIEAFSERIGRHFTRESLLSSDEETLRQWCIFSSERVTKLMTGLGKIVKKPGIMIMDSGDERHGISPRDIAKIPDIQVRIGEQHFFDDSARSCPERLINFLAVTGHLFRLGPDIETYSETTVVSYIPEIKETTPEHTYSKVLLSLTAGVKNIDWMCTKHYGMMKERYRDIRAYYSETCGERAYPVHVARDSFTSGQSYYADTYATALGLPAAPVFADEACGAEILVIPDHLYGLPEWKKAAEKYKYAVRPGELKEIIGKTSIPHAETPGPLCLSYIPSRRRVALFNPMEEEQTASVCGKSIRLDAGGAGYIDI